MKKISEYPNCLVAVDAISHFAYLIDGPEELKINMDGACLQDNMSKSHRSTLPENPGIYLMTIAFCYEEGYLDGYTAPGESLIDLAVSNIRRVERFVRSG